MRKITGEREGREGVFTIGEVYGRTTVGGVR